jgi:multidrug resistance protein
MTPIASSLLGVAAGDIAKEFHLTDAFTPTLPVALFVLGLGLGPLYLEPCSEMYGRRIVYLVSFGIFTVFDVGCALAPNVAVLSILRLLAGMAGSAGPSLGGATIGDRFAREHRGKAQALYGFGPTGGPVLGGLLGGFIVHGTGTWRWCMWIMAIASGVTFVTSVFFLRETCSSVLLRQKAKSLRNQTGLAYTTNVEFDAKKQLSRAILRPPKLLFFSPICAAMSCVYVSL